MRSTAAASWTALVAGLLSAVAVAACKGGGASSPASPPAPAVAIPPTSGTPTPTPAPTPDAASGATGYASGTVALTVENVNNPSAGLADPEGFGLTGSGTGTGTGTATVGVSSFTPVHYVIPIGAINLINSTGANKLVTPAGAAGSTATATATGTTLALAGTGTGTGPAAAGPVTGDSGTGGGAVNPNNVVLYKCAESTEAGCMVDLTDNIAMASKFGTPVSVPVGTFDTLSFAELCTAGLGQAGFGDGKGFHVQVQGQIVVNGTTYYTAASPGGLSTAQADLGLAQATIRACGGASAVKFSAPITVAAGDKVTVSMFLSAGDIAWGGTDNNYPPAGCTDPGPATYVCVGLPSVVPVLGTAKPTVERYKVDPAPNSFCAGQVTMLIDNANVPLGVFIEPLYSAASGHPGSIWDAGATMKTNADGTYDLYGGTDPGAAGPRVELPSFQRATHSGTLRNAGTPFSYTATKQ